VSVAVVLALASLMFAISARQGSTERAADLADLAGAQSDRVAAESARVDALRAEVDELAAKAGTGVTVGQVSEGYQVASGSTPVSGRGLVVTLDDAPSDSVPAGISPDVLVVHQQDLQAVMNALWAGGAEAMGLQDQRVVSTSAFRCVGNVLRLHGQVYSPPYVVQAIGDPQAMRAALDASPAVRAYLRDAAEVGLGWSVTTADEIELPAYSSSPLEYAHVPDGVEVLPGLGGVPAGSSS
jgi:uncharacterized protein YlxW (UPF0749 family)